MMRLPDENSATTKVNAIARRDEVPAPEAYQRAPTLMAGETAGAQGGVRIWAPSKKKMQSEIAWGFSLLSGFLVCLWYWHAWFPALYPLGFGIVALIHSVRVYLRPCYLTTDDFGIGITTAHGSRSLKWSQIDRLEWKDGRRRTGFILQAPGWIEADLTGHSLPLRRELVELIIAHAGLVPHHWREYVFVRGSALPKPVQVAKLSPPPPVYGDLGMTFLKDETGALMVHGLADYSVAAEAGIFAGDEVLEIDGRRADRLSVEEAAAGVSGLAGKIVILVVRRAEWHGTLEFRIEIRAASTAS